jgi:hypothetical protein
VTMARQDRRATGAPSMAVRLSSENQLSGVDIDVEAVGG